jgi:hypothetical protein
LEGGKAGVKVVETLLAFDGFEEGLEVAFAEAAASLALDDLVEEVGRSSTGWVKICSM